MISCDLNAQGRCCLKDAFMKLKSQCGIKSILIEGGAEIIQSVLQLKLCNQVVLTLKPVYFGGYRALTKQLDSPVHLLNVSTVRVEEDILIHGLLPSFTE